MSAAKRRRRPPIEPPDDQMLTPEMLVAKWGCSLSWIYGQISSGKLKAHWLGGWKIEPWEAERFKESQTHAPPPVVTRRKPGPKKQKYLHVRKGV